MFHFYNPWKHKNAFGFLMSSGGIEVEHWLKIGKDPFWIRSKVFYRVTVLKTFINSQKHMKWSPIFSKAWPATLIIIGLHCSCFPVH